MARVSLIINGAKLAHHLDYKKFLAPLLNKLEGSELVQARQASSRSANQSELEGGAEAGGSGSA
ncbi:hypothetical protein E2562_002579 [Oryza meyeriana var. granulata]|uniref:Uncharacterized protein n=1 Tax=Oryza meyeriana var. granulata TaxID=110450 RepID=A0A6G1F2V8_9ORYZ|nr:hypothetical protein E2562_002579 [Oryza meyeriana var. granulata]